MTPREIATLLDALQGWIDRRRATGGHGILNLARPEHFDRVEPLDAMAAQRLYHKLKQYPPDSRYVCPACQAIGFAPALGTTAVGDQFIGCEFCTQGGG